MSAVSRICIRCRIRILNNGPVLPSAAALLRSRGQRSLLSARLHPRDPEQSRAYSSFKITHTYVDPVLVDEQPRRKREEEYPLADPVKVKLHGRLLPDDSNPRLTRRTTKGITTAAVEQFLAKVKKTKKTEHVEATPIGADAIKLDRTYEMLLRNGGRPPRPKREPIDPSLLPPQLQDLDAKFNFPAATNTIALLGNHSEGREVVLHGYIRTVRKISRKLVFLSMYDFENGPSHYIQLVSSINADSTEEQIAMHESLFKLPPFVPVCVKGTVVTAKPMPISSDTPDDNKIWTEPPKPEILLESLTQLNSVDPNLIYTPETVFPFEKRHLQLRTSTKLAKALRMRDNVSALCRSMLRRNRFIEVETPLLFKSTPEGAREFLVPTRSKENGGGMCYALPQSPQQYKQILMASGIPRYFQLAKCFRDEDLRADRQPEFTQLDLEMSFSRQEEVMDVITRLLRELWQRILGIDIGYEIKKMTYREALTVYGSDKPDLRFAKYKIFRRIPFREHPTGPRSIDAFYIRRTDRSPKGLEAMKTLHDQFVAEHQREGPDRFISYVAGEETANGVPEHHLTAADIENLNDRMEIVEGDIVILRETREKELASGSTRLGRLRTALINKAVEAGIMHVKPGFEFVWITEFPLFSPVDASEPGQSGRAGLASTHHPFTAPHEDDFDLLATDPRKVRAEHYDIVVNGVELGGGSRRIHDPVLQRYILEEIIKVHPDKIHQFDHLIEVLGSGCPPHAGIALGFDRLIAVMMGTDSVRDVIAFPKNSNGADPMVKSPSRARDVDLATYHLQRIPQAVEEA